jgi:cytoskeletal protein CcmA (bactofilin family)
VVLLVVMTVTVLSLGFLSRSDVELACGRNMGLKTQMDYLAESGLVHARGLILNPQDVDSEYWTGATSQQLVLGSDDYYDVAVLKFGECNYQITCDAYRQKAGSQIGRHRLVAELRLNPCLVLWTGADTVISQRITIDGDVYCAGNVSGSGFVRGDVFAQGGATPSNVWGQVNESVAQPPLTWPGLELGAFSPDYHIGAVTYLPQIVDSNVHPAGSFAPSAGNPAGIRCCAGQFELPGGVNITGMLVVDGTLKIKGANNVIRAVKNFPALLVSGEVIFEDGGTLEIEGLAQIGQRVVFNPGSAFKSLTVYGALFIANGSIDGATSDTVFVDLIARPSMASIQIWPQVNTLNRWGPAAGAFFKRIQRQ